MTQTTLYIEDIEEIWADGWDAFDNGVPYTACPHSDGASHYWQSGWRMGKQAKEMLDV